MSGLDWLLIGIMIGFPAGIFAGLIIAERENRRLERGGN
jgi:hypothetical protein